MRRRPHQIRREPKPQRQQAQLAPIPLQRRPPEHRQQERNDRRQEQPPHDKHMRRPGGRPRNPYAVNPRADIRQIRRYQQQPDRDNRNARRIERPPQRAAQIRAILVRLQRQRPQQQRRECGQIPHIVERQPAQRQARRPYRRVWIYAAPLPLPTRRQPIHIQRHPREQRDERQRHHMRVHIPQYKAEEREFLYRVVYEMLAVKGVDDARRPEPPPMLRGRPTLRRRCVGAVKPVYAYPIPEPLRTHPVEPHKLQRALQVGYHDQQPRRRRARYRRMPPARLVRPNHIERQPEYPRSRQRRYHSHCQVVRYVRGNARQLRQQPHHPIPEVVVANGLAPQPRILRMPRHRVHRRVQQRQIHRLLSVIDERIRRLINRPPDEERQEHRLRQRDSPPLPHGEGPKLPPIAIGVHPRRPRQRRHKRNRRNLPARNIRQPQRPEKIRDRQYAEGLAESVAPIGKARH